MRCPECDSNNDTVIDSRSSGRGRRIRRRRECGTCGHRFTTMELNRDELFDLTQIGVHMEKKSEPIIVMIVTNGGASVMVDNTECLRPDQMDGFLILADQVHRFAAGLVDKAIEMQNPRQETVN